jgi:hypothetical protein
MEYSILSTVQWKKQNTKRTIRKTAKGSKLWRHQFNLPTSGLF